MDYKITIEDGRELVLEMDNASVSKKRLEAYIKLYFNIIIRTKILRQE